jgi:pantoate kinase
MTNIATFSPCNITGFFRIHSEPRDPTQAGSTGASVAISKGVTTRVTAKKARRSTFSVNFNGQPLTKNSVSALVVRKYIELEGNSWNIEVDHRSQLPTGCGYGTSGAGALSLSLALNEALEVSLSRVEAAQIAHVSEVECKTGLGTVASVFSGGFGLRTAPGAPGVGKITKISVPRTLRLVTATFGPISTHRVLGNALLKDRVNRCGKDLVEKFDTDHLQTSFMELSRKFSDCLSLMSQRLKWLVGRLDSAGFKSSMVMLGESLFCMSTQEEAGEISTIVRSAGIVPIVTAVCGSGARLL